MESLIPLINELHGIFQTIGSHTIELPQIVVVGDQVRWRCVSTFFVSKSYL
jgi:hypothetical protein